MFKQIDDHIVLDNGSTRFICTLAEFTDATVEPDYAGLPEGIVCITYDPGGEGVHMSDGENQQPLDPGINQTTLAGYVADLDAIKAAVEAL